MKFIILSAFFFFIMNNVHAACSKKIDNSKVMLFIDTNQSDMEIAVAEKAACDRGQKLSVVPNNYKEYREAIKNVNDKEKVLRLCAKKATGKGCIAQEKEFVIAKNKHQMYLKEQPNFEQKIQEELEKIRRDKGSLENLTISGHDGGGMYSGLKGTINRNTVFSALERFKDINNVKSVMLLGCYTSVPREITEWITAFPNLKMVAGYDGSAPLAFRPEGHDYFYNLLMQEKNLTTTGDQNKVKSILAKNFKSMNLITASMFLKSSCQMGGQGEKLLYYGTTDEKKALREFDMKECEKVQPLVESLQESLTTYYEGDLEPPVDTVNGKLRGIYSKTRRYEHCFPHEKMGSIAFGLLFFDSIKANFSNLYKDDLAKSQSILNSITQADLDKIHNERIESLKTYEDKVNNNKEKLDLLTKNPEAYIEARKEDLTKSEKDLLKLLEGPEYKELTKKFPEMSLPLDQIDFFRSPDPDEQKLVEVWMGKIINYNTVKRDIDEIEKDKQGFIEFKKNVLGGEIASSQYAFEDMKRKTDRSKISVEDLKKVWIPTSENLKVKTRAEILENIHNISGVLTSSSLPKELEGALRFTESLSTRKLEELEVPFSWHEYTGHTEGPLEIEKLQDFMRE